jgi:hypothetical protein
MGAPMGNKNAAGSRGSKKGKMNMTKRRKKEEKARAWIRKNTSKANKKRILKSKYSF